MQTVADFVDGEFFGFGQSVGRGGECFGLEKEADLVARGEEVFVANVVRGVRCEFRHRVGGERKFGKQAVRGGEEGRALGWGEI